MKAVKGAAPYIAVPIGVALTFAVALAVVTAPAQAKGKTYPGDGGARSFGDGPAGWKGSTGSEGLCVEAAQCPAVSNDYRASGGSDGAGDGYLRTSIDSLSGVGATSTGTWTSPAFRYRGVRGKAPKQLGLKLVRRADVEALLSAEGNEATYSVRLLDVTGGDDVTAVDAAALTDANRWTAIRTRRIDPSLMTIGDRYRIAITSTFETGADVVPGGTVDYDGVRLRAKGGARSGGGPGDGGPKGSGGHSSGGHDPRGGGVASHAPYDGRSVVVKARCGRKVRGKCRMRLVGRYRRHGANVTKRHSVKVRAGHRKKVRLPVKGRYLARTANRDALVVKARVKVRHRHARVSYRRVALRQG